MRLNSSYFVILILLVIFLSGCRASAPEILPTATETQTTFASPTAPITPFPTVAPPTETVHPSATREATLSVANTPTATPLPPNAAAVPNFDDYTWEVVAEGFERPTGLAAPADSSGRLFILEQPGLIYIVQAGAVLPEPFLDLRERTSTRGSTVRGLLGLTFHPNFAQNGYFYVHYTQEGGSSVIARYQVSGDPNRADPGSETRLLEISYPLGEHVGGGLEFGPEGLLYISVGDGGAAGNGDSAGNAQNPETFLGSILRLDVDHGGEPQIWAKGLRNPWRFSFDRLTGDLFIGDVGENLREEINYVPVGFSENLNFGWNYWEGNLPFLTEPPTGPEVIFPIWEYDHTQGCAVTGGYVYRGKSLPEWFGVYIYGDYCTGNVWGLLQNPDGSWQNQWLTKLPAYITSFGQDEAGELYLVSITGKVLELVKK